MSDAVTVTGSVHNYPAIPECDLGTHLGSLLESGSYSDVTLAVGDKEFKAHKAILAGMSPPPWSPGTNAPTAYGLA